MEQPISSSAAYHLAVDLHKYYLVIGSAAGLIPLVWVPPLAVRELRALLAHRRRLVRTQTVLKNRLHSLLHRLQIAPPEGDPFCAKHRAWWAALQVSPTERLHVQHDLATLDQVVGQLSEIDDELRRLSCAAPWSDVTPYLMHLPGVGLIVAMTILAAIGDITRFPTSKKLVGYSGLAAGVHDSGQTHRTGHTLAPRLRAAQVPVSPKKAVRNCATSWSKPLGMPSRPTTFGKPSLSVSADV